LPRVDHHHRAPVFAPCLLGCRGTARQYPAACGTTNRRLPYKLAGTGIARHQTVFTNSCSSRLLIRWHADHDHPIDVTATALTGFVLDCVIEFFAAAIVVWQLRGEGEERDTRAVRLIGVTFFALALYLATEGIRDLITHAPGTPQ
jgi:hypothetical protein